MTFSATQSHVVLTLTQAEAHLEDGEHHINLDNSANLDFNGMTLALSSANLMLLSKRMEELSAAAKRVRIARSVL
jgi:Tfp pilus assembly protein PilX